VFTLCSAFFVVRTKENVLLERRDSHPVNKSTGVRSDQTVILTTIESAKAYPDPLRRVSYLDIENKCRLKFLTNNFQLPAQMIAQIYKFKQHLRIKAFYGTSDNASQDSDLDRRLGLCPGGDHPQAPRVGDESLANSTDFQHHPA
jgi:hypothetical protein